jgi:hypothetical protein
LVQDKHRDCPPDHQTRKSQHIQNSRHLKDQMVVSINCATISAVSDKSRSVVPIRLQEASRRTIPRLESRNDKTLALPSFPLWAQVQHHHGTAYDELG